ncbi:MAG: Glu-tRNA(Gln) amidotransferase GatDE subunit D, partial [Candidatus Bipolaricaulota bacterium]|nr:Glu-tRNA(Gln) amidotransferase GatDE subunit D [Candidatus Bipolaricaulota bacterium]
MCEAQKGYKGEALDALVKFSVGVWSDVDIDSTRGHFRGIILPRSEFDDSRHLVIKLATGYNVGIDVRTLRSVTELGRREAHYKIPEKEFPTSP